MTPLTPAETSNASGSCLRQFELIGSTAEGAMRSIRRVGDRAGILEVICTAERVA